MKGSLIFFMSMVFSIHGYAGLIKSDFLNSGDGLLVTDDATNLEWLSPTHTANNAYDSSFVQSVKNNYGFEYATATQVLQMISSNFGNISTVFPGDITSGVAIRDYLDIFGITLDLNCTRNRVTIDCPRTSAFTGTAGVNSGTQTVLGLILYGNTGFMINYDGQVAQTQQQVGSWLVRSGPVQATVSSPATFYLMLLGVVGLAAKRRYLRRK